MLCLGLFVGVSPSPVHATFLFLSLPSAATGCVPEHAAKQWPRLPFVWRAQVGSTKTSRRLTEFAHFIHFILTPDILVITKVDPSLVGLALLGDRHYCVALR